jgi:uncharacterized protein with FMN-binding domain
MNVETERRNAESNPEQKSVVPRKAPAAKGSRSTKIARNLVVASAAAILSVYVAGYAATQSAAAQIAAQETPPSGPNPGTSAGGPATDAAGAATTTATGATSATSTYKDGTYSGVGTSRHGSIQAQVVIQGGKIVSVRITGSTTRFPTSAIAGLPGEVVARQSPNVDYVSGATDSSMAFMQAVADALAQASGGGS